MRDLTPTVGIVSGADRRRGRLILRVIATERLIRGVLLIGAGVYLLFHRGSDFGRVAERVMRAIELDPRRHFLHRLVQYLHGLHAHELLVAALLALGYGALELIEGVGLWLDQLWAEYLVVIATSLLIPLEVYELLRKPTLWKAGGILINLLIVLYLARVLRRRLASNSSAKLQT